MNGGNLGSRKRIFQKNLILRSGAADGQDTVAHFLQPRQNLADPLALSGNARALRSYERFGFAPYALDPAAGQALLLQKWL